MPNDINELDEQDVGLKGIFGDRFTDMSAEDGAESNAEQDDSREVKCTPRKAKFAQKSEHKLVDGSNWNPPKPEPTMMDRLKASVKHVAIYGGLNLLIWYWQIAGLMDEKISVPCMLVCAILAGWNVGRNFARELRR